MLTNTKVFQEVGNYFRENKVYTKYPENSYGYIEFWKEEHRKCLEGVSIGNLKIPGAYYFYLNYKPILRRVKYSNRKVLDFPQFTDVDLEYFNLIERARKEGKGVILVKPRRIGFTYKNSSLAEYEYNFFPNSRTFLSAFESKYSLGLMDMTLHGLNFLDDYTPWRKQRNPDTRTHIRSRYKETDGGTEVWRGYDSEIEVLTFKNNPFAGAGKSGSLFIFDEVGIFPNIIQSYNISEPTWKDGDTVTGLPILGGSAGDMESGSLEFSQMFYNPEDYNLLAMDNIWDEGKEGTRCGWFIPSYRMRFGKYKDVSGKYPDRDGEEMVDSDGNSIEDLALQSVLDFRNTKNESKKALKDAITQYPLNTREAFLRRTSNFFPTKDIMYRLSEVENNPILKKSFYTGDLIFQEGEKIPYLVPNEKNKAITDFPLRNVDEIEGAIEIYEKPKVDGSGNVKAGRYILGCLPPGEKVITDSGLKDIETITLKDKLISKDGKIVDIINLQKYEVQEESIYKVKVANTYRTTTFTKEHPIYSSERKLRYINYLKSKRLGISQRYYEFNFRFKKVEELSTNDWIQVPNIYRKEITPEYNKLWNSTNTGVRVDRRIKNPLNNKDFWWFVGLWLGDGWCEKNGHDISIALNKNEAYYINKITNIFSNLFNRAVSKRVRNNSEEVKICFQQLNRFMTINFGKYALNKKIPEWVKYLKKEYKIQLIQGYLDSDGSIYKFLNNKYSYSEFTSINLELLEGFQDILFSLDIVSSITKLRDAGKHIIANNNKPSKTKKTYHLRLGHHDTLSLVKLIDDYDDHKIKRIGFNNLPKVRRNPKNNCYLSEDKNYIYFKVLKIEKSKFTGNVYNFECDTHTYMCHHITTHNCDPVDDDGNSNIENSLQSTLVFDLYTDRIVAEYSGRTSDVRIYYENVRRLALYYNAIINYENNKKGLFGYFNNMNSLYLLCDVPKYLKDTELVKAETIGNKSKGTPSGSKYMIKHYEDLINSYLLSQAFDKEPGINNIHTLRGEALMKELIAYDRNVNTDRVSALAMVLVLREELFKITDRNNDKEENIFNDDFFNRNKKNFLTNTINIGNKNNSGIITF